MRKKIAAGNWKMNTNFEEAVQLAQAITDADIPEDVTVILGVPFVYLQKIKGITNANDKIFVSAQNCHQNENGAYTGEISATMLNSIEIPYVILGHSERREYFSETPLLLKDKVNIALKNGLNIIFCVGESLDIRKAGKHQSYVFDQIRQSLKGLTNEEMKSITIAYEPIWAIGTGETASPSQAQSMHKAIRQYLGELFDRKIAEDISILYGGSVNPGNARELFSMPDVDGGLVGGASLKEDSFVDIIKSF